MAEKYIDDVIEHLESDILKIQTKPNMYISYLGSKGSLHLGKELINNAIDECINEKSPADTIDVYLDEGENTITVSDNGRGIPPESLEVVSTTLQSGSKFTRSGGNATAGENGVGITAANSLSEIFEIISYRNDYRYTISFRNGIKQEDIKKEKLKKERHGTTFVMKTSEYYMGKNCGIIADDLIGWLDKIVYLMDPSIKLTLKVSKKGSDAIITKKYINKNGLLDYMKFLVKKPAVEPMEFSSSIKVLEHSRDKETDRNIKLNFVFTFDQTGNEFISDSFCNYVNTIDNGTHVDAVKQSIMQFLSKQTRDNLSEREAKKLDILFNDVTQGLVLIVNLETDLNPQYTGC